MSSNLNYIAVTEPMAGAGGAFTDTLNRALRNVLSLSGYNPDATIFPGLAGPVYNVNAFGADPSGVADSSTAINAAAAALAANGKVYAPAGGIYKIASTVTFRTHVEMTGAQFNYTGTGIAVQAGITGTNNLTQLMTMRFPRVTQTLSRAAGVWPRADTGIKLLQCIGCTFFYSGIDNFATGLRVEGEDNGCDYNVHHLGTFFGNKVSLSADPAVLVTGAWCNENTYIGGRLTLDTADVTGANTKETGVPGVRYIYLGDSQLGTNNHRFIGTSLEGHVPEYTVESRGSFAAFDHCRWETDATVTGMRFYLNGPNALYTRIRGGYNANKLKFTYAGGAGSVEVQNQDGIRTNTAAADGHLVLHNGNGPDNPSVLIVPDPFAGPATNTTAYQMRLSDKSLRGKATADASDRITIDFSVGTIDGITLKSGATNAGLAANKPSLSSAGKFITLAASASATIPGAAYATFDMVEGNSGQTALIKTNAGSGSVIFQSGTVFSGVSGTASKINVFATGGNLVIQNNTAGTISLSGTINQLV